MATSADAVARGEAQQRKHRKDSPSLGALSPSDPTSNYGYYHTTVCRKNEAQQNPLAGAMRHHERPYADGHSPRKNAIIGWSICKVLIAAFADSGREAPG